ncbi:MAG: DUF4118 domain-containing protein [Candidatus Nanopelagicales bacterium]
MLLALGAIVGTLAVAAAMRPVGLAEVLLIVLVEVVVVSIFAGRKMAALTAVASFLAVNWLLIPPYGTLHIQAQENWVALAVFLVLAVGASSLVEVALASERAAATAAARAAVLADLLRPDAASSKHALQVLVTALDLDAAELVNARDGQVLRSTDPDLTRRTGAPALTVEVAPSLRVVGWGSERLGASPEYVTALATAAVRAWESEQLVAEQERSARLAEVDAARAALLATVGHDLRTPLAGMRVSAEALALSDDLAEEDRRELLDGLRQSALRLDEVLGAVLDVSRIEAGVAGVEPRPTDIALVVDGAVADFASPRLQVQDAPGPVLATTDPVLLERIVANLVANALAHTPLDSPVEVTCHAEGTGAVVAVVDHGPGLAPAAIDVGRDQHGMGLLIVERLAALTGARIQRGTTPGGGLTVTVRLDGAA